jgi:hypothetical protein
MGGTDQGQWSERAVIRSSETDRQIRFSFSAVRQWRKNARMRETPLSGTENAETERAIYFQFAQLAGEESQLLADLAINLRFASKREFTPLR